MEGKSTQSALMETRFSDLATRVSDICLASATSVLHNTTKHDSHVHAPQPVLHHHHHNHVPLNPPQPLQHSIGISGADPQKLLRTNLRLRLMIFHKKFLEAVALLGGPQRAQPKDILKVMNVENFTIANVETYLMKYRLLYSKRNQTQQRILPPCAPPTQSTKSCSMFMQQQRLSILGQRIRSLKNARVFKEVKRVAPTVTNQSLCFLQTGQPFQEFAALNERKLKGLECGAPTVTNQDPCFHADIATVFKNLQL